MIIDCDRCAVRDIACGDCVIGVLLGSTGPVRSEGAPAEVPSGASKVQFDAPERHALDVLAAQGLVPRLRLVAAPRRRATGAPDSPRPARDAG